MAYITYGELLARYPQFSRLHEGNEALINSYSIAPAEAELNARLAAAYTVPFSVAYPVIKDLAWDLCYAKMMLTVDPEKYRDLYDSVVDRINRLVNGDDVILDNDGEPVEASSASSGIWSNNMNYHPVHSMLDAEDPNTKIDQDQIINAESERA